MHAGHLPPPGEPRHSRATVGRDGAEGGGERGRKSDERGSKEEEKSAFICFSNLFLPLFLEDKHSTRHFAFNADLLDRRLSSNRTETFDKKTREVFPIADQRPSHVSRVERKKKHRKFRRKSAHVPSAVLILECLCVCVFPAVECGCS